MQLKLFPDPLYCTGLVASRSRERWPSQCRKLKHIFKSQDIILGSNWREYYVIEEISSEDVLVVKEYLDIKKKLSSFRPPHMLWIIRCSESNKKVWKNIIKYLNAETCIGTRTTAFEGKANEIVSRTCDKFSGKYISPLEFIEKK